MQTLANNRPARALALVAMTCAAVVTAPRQAAASDKRTLLAAVENYEKGKFKEAALQFFEVAEQSGEDDLMWRAEYYLALTLSKMGLFHSALVYDKLIIEQGPEHPYYLEAVTNLVEVMEGVGDKSIVPSMLDSFYSERFAELPDALINRINFIVALWSHQQRKIGESKDFLEAVPKEASTYPRARYLRGVQVAREALESAERGAELNAEAAALFEEVLSLKSTKEVPYADLADLKQLSTIALARVRFAEGRFEDSLNLYNRIPRFSRLWRDALFEGAYAAFQNDDYGKALGLLHTLHSPAAKDHVLPESWLLKSYVYYFSCLFDEAKNALGTLQASFPEQAEEIDALLTGGSDPAFFYELLLNGKSGDVTLAPALRNELLADEGIRSYRSFIAALERESKALQAIPEWKRGDLADVLVDQADQTRNLMVQTAGKAIARGLQRIKLDIEIIDSQADLVRFELAGKEKNLLETGHDAEAVLARQKLGRPRMQSGQQYWEFDGEFWPDEIGTYQYTLKNACPPQEASASASR